jgi:hypothetical protein
MKPARGQIAALAALADLTQSPTEEARRLQALGHSQGIHTTTGSLKQAIQLRKRKAGGGRKRPAKSLDAGRVLEAAIEALEGLREYVVGLEVKNEDLTSKLNQLHQILKR